MSDLMVVVHGVLVAALGLVIVMLKRAQDGAAKKSINGVGELYKRIESAEPRVMDKLDALSHEIVRRP